MQIAILINEDFKKMVVGANTTLGYILAAVDLGHDVFVYKIDEKGSLRKKDKAIFLNAKNVKNLLEKFRERNAYIGTVSVENIEPLQDKLFVFDVEKKFEEREFSFDEIDFIIQRLEPMKPPFPPFGEIDIKDFLQEFSTKIFAKNKNYNLPINCFGDKELPLMLDDKNVAVPTKISFFYDEDLAKKVKEIGKKVILKPDNSAQGYGVFLLEFESLGLDLQQILQEKLSNLIKWQSFRIKDGIDDAELKKILKILFFVQDLKAKKQISNKRIVDFSDNEINDRAVFLYGKKILIQPFIEGIKNGDVRVILVKIKQEFVIIGAVFRKNIIKNDRDFITGIMAGGSVPVPFEDYLTSDEQKDLFEKVNYVVNQLNTKFRQKYENCREIGLDFLLFGDKKHVFLGEANHYCQGLIPFFEAILAKKDFHNKIKGDKISYNGGLGVIKEIILASVK